MHIQLRQNYKMLEQQNLIEECTEQPQPISAPVISKIDHESSRIKNFVTQLRLSKKKSNGQYSYTPFQIQNQSQISNIQPVSQKLQRNSFQLDLPNDISTRRNAYTMVPISKDKILGGDQALKYRPRGSVNGRDDIRVKNLNEIHKKIIGGAQKRRNQNNSSPKQSQNLQSALTKLEQLQNPQHNSRRNYLSTSKVRFNISTPKIKNSFYNSSSPKRPSHNDHTTRNSDFVGPKPKKFQITNKNYVQIQAKQLMQYIKKQKQSNFPTHDSQPTKIFQFFTSLCTNFGMSNDFNEPLIKRYRNCIYFGQKVPDYDNYIGFVWYFRKALYYGEFQKGRKHGFGVEIDLQDQSNQCIWRGTFTNGKKTGYFQLTSPKMQYYGSLVNSYFDGQGMLKIKGYSVYKGIFQAGMKHGFGVENFQNKKLLNYKGQYFQNKFQGNGQLQGPNYFYKGHFKNNKADGFGFQRTDQFQYEGQFKQGKKQGHGTIKLKNGQKFQGIFQNGHITKQITFGNNQKPNNKKSSVKKIQATVPVKNQYQKDNNNQYTRSIKIQGFSRNQQQNSLAPSNILPKQSSMKIPRSQPKKKPQEQQQQQQNHHNFIRYNQNLISKKYLDSQQNNNSNSQTKINPNFKANVDIKTYSSRIVPLQKHLSKRLNSLYQQNQNQQGTIDPVIRHHQLPKTIGIFKMHEVQINPQTFIHPHQNSSRSHNKVPFDSHVSRIQEKNKNQLDQYDHVQANSDGEEQPLQIKILPRQ